MAQNYRPSLTVYSRYENIVLLNQCDVVSVHVISRKILRDFCQKHADSCEALFAWYRVATKAHWQSLPQIQASYPKAEAVGNFTVFNIKGNTYRLIVDINYVKQRIYIKYILTHADYDKDLWKNDLYF